MEIPACFVAPERDCLGVGACNRVGPLTSEALVAGTSSKVKVRQEKAREDHDDFLSSPSADTVVAWMSSGHHGPVGMGMNSVHELEHSSGGVHEHFEESKGGVR